MANILLLERRSAAREAISDRVSGRTDWYVLSARSIDEARSLIEAGPVDLVLADLHAAGPECPAFISELAPLPVIVTSERDGVGGVIDALEAGAVNYIPGHLQRDRLVGAIEAALSSAFASSQRTKLLGWMEFSWSRFSIPTEHSMLSVAADRLQASLEMFGLCDAAETVHVRIALDEALANAFYHGNLGVSSELKESESRDFERLARQRLQELPYRDRRIEIEEHLTRQEARFIIRDQGDGFDVASVQDPTAPDRLLLSSGRGILMMRHFLDEVRYNPKGNEVTLVKRGRSRAHSGSENEQELPDCLARL